MVLVLIFFTHCILGTCADFLPQSISGVSVSFLKTFRSEYEKDTCLFNKSTAEVCDKLIKSATAKEKISYVELLQRTEKSDCVGNAIRFMSHAWACEFGSVVETICQKCKSEGLAEKTCFIWFDIFSLSQYSGIEDFDLVSKLPRGHLRDREGVDHLHSLPTRLVGASLVPYAVVEAGVQFEIPSSGRINLLSI